MRKKGVIIFLLILAAASIYIGLSSAVINKNYYRELAYKLENYHKTIIDWETADVSLIKVKDTPFDTPPIFSAKINRTLLFLNGGYAVRVELSTTQDDFFGPIVLFFNPFTKQCIGGYLRR